MGHLIGIRPLALFLCALAAAPLASGPSSRKSPEKAATAVGFDSVSARSPAVNGAPGKPASVSPGQPASAQRRPQRTGPLKKLIFSARDGFAMRMVSSQEVTAEIRNGAGRTLARGDYTLEPGDWILRPRNMAPGLYTVHLRNGRQLRAVKMKIEDPVRGQGAPEWVLERAAPGFDSLQAPGPFPEVPRRGASASP